MRAHISVLQFLERHLVLLGVLVLSWDRREGFPMSMMKVETCRGLRLYWVESRFSALIQLGGLSDDLWLLDLDRFINILLVVVPEQMRLQVAETGHWLQDHAFGRLGGAPQVRDVIGTRHLLAALIILKYFRYHYLFLPPPFLSLYLLPLSDTPFLGLPLLLGFVSLVVPLFFLPLLDDLSLLLPQFSQAHLLQTLETSYLCFFGG